MRLIFMGTPDFSVGILEALHTAGHEIVLVVTQADKPKGRGGQVQAPPVKIAALKMGFPVYQPKRVREPESVETLRSYQADCIVVAAFGQILPKEILEMPKYGCVNVHASLLPRYRGASPIQWAVIDGEKVSGVTTMRMDEGLDTGDMILKKEVVLDEDETAGSLFDRLAVVGAELCVGTLQSIEDGTATYTPQKEDEATYTTMIKKEMGNLDFSKSAVEIERLIRGLSPWPGTFTQRNGKTLKIWKAMTAEDGLESEAYKEKNPGTVVLVDKDHVFLQTGDGLLSVKEVQPEGKKRMEIDAYLRGYPLEVGIVLGKTEL